MEYEAPEDQGGLISLFTGFKWNPRCSVSCNVVEGIRNPTGSLLEMMYRMNERFMGVACITVAPMNLPFILYIISMSDPVGLRIPSTTLQDTEHRGFHLNPVNNDISPP